MSITVTPEYMAELHSYATDTAVQLRHAGLGRREGRDMPVFLHCSDIHNSVSALHRILAYYEYHKDWITEVLHTGDITNCRFCEHADILEDPGMKTMLNITGNHDGLYDAEGWNWDHVAPSEEMYQRYFAPFHADWGVVMEENTTYWYKDYDQYMLRLVAVDTSRFNCEPQYAWLKATLEEARLKGYHIIIAAHHTAAFGVPIRCGFTTIAKMRHTCHRWETLEPQIQQIVQDFMDAGGEFVCYLTGHQHADYLWVSGRFPQQLIVTVDTANPGQATYSSDTHRVLGTRTEDLFNLFSYDLKNHIVKIVRVGANVDCTMQRKDFIAVDYKTMQVIG